MHLEYEDVYLQFLELFYQQQYSITTADADHEITATNMADSNENVLLKELDTAGGNGKAMMNTVDHHQPTIRKRCSKKDRHSKINTARGPRDRRMRLSLDIARKFFDLQDLLGYDKASRTVDWLLRNSRPAIRELARGRGLVAAAHNDQYVNPSCSLVGANSVSSTSEDCEVVSSSTTYTVVPSKRTVEEPPAPSCTKLPKVRTKKVKRVARATVATESRRKARERARERTSQKRRLIFSDSTTEEPQLFGESVFSHSFKESAGSHVPIYDMQAGQVEDLSSNEPRVLEATDEAVVTADSAVCTVPWNPSTVFNYQDNAVFLHQVSITLTHLKFVNSHIVFAL